VLQVVTWLADEKIVLGATVLFWAYAQVSRQKNETKRRADHLLYCVVLAGALPHVFKRLVDRERPDRVVVRARRHGIPRSGNAWDSFPSGHALHLGAIAGSIADLCPSRFRPLIWPSITTLAATRILLLAHYLSDVVAGLALGVLLDNQSVWRRDHSRSHARYSARGLCTQFAYGIDRATPKAILIWE
jgi:membrane-associated phospholipid phosphatase